VKSAKQSVSTNLDSAKLAARLGAILGHADLGKKFELLLQHEGQGRTPALAALLSLAEQTVDMGIDYRTLGLGWHHPRSRMEYRSGSHPSQKAEASRERASQSRQSLVEVAKSILKGEISWEDALMNSFVREIGLKPISSSALNATFHGVAAALDAELLLPLRALNEGLLAEDNEVHTMHGELLTKPQLQRTVVGITSAVLSNCFADWRYCNPVGMEQLRGLSGPQSRQWRHPLAMDHDGGLHTHEDDIDELGLFWATKIGGPSHGFDYCCHCVLPLLANARQKVIFLNDARWSHFPAGRAHFRLMWTAGSCFGGTLDRCAAQPEPRLWLEALHRDSAAEKHGVGTELQLVMWIHAVLRHALAKSDAMQVALSVNPNLTPILSQVVEGRNNGGQVRTVDERILLRPSNGIVEASDELSPKHDWLQLIEEVTEPLRRTLYLPPATDCGVAEPSSSGPYSCTVHARRSRRAFCF
jgi:hypothetical protein